MRLPSGDGDYSRAHAGRRLEQGHALDPYLGCHLAREEDAGGGRVPDRCTYTLGSIASDGNS